MANRRNTLYIFIIASFLLGLFTGRAYFFSLAYLLLALLLIAFLWSLASTRGLAIARKTRTKRAQVGRTLGEVFTVRNLSWLPKLWLELEDYSELPGHRASHVIPTLGPRRSYKWYVDTECVVRGRFRLGPMGISSGDPFGLFRRERKTAGGLTVVVYPQTLPLAHFHIPAGLLSGGEPRRQRSPTITTNAAGIRDYVTGDSFNRIHWASSARRDHLMVKEFEIDPLADVWLFADFSAESLVEAPGLIRADEGRGAVIPRGRSIPCCTEEYVVAIAATLANHLIESKRALGFSAYVPHREVYQPERGHRQMLHMLEALAIARSTSPYSFAEMLVLETPYIARGTTLLLITSSLDARWIYEAQILSRKGLRPMVVLVDPVSFGGQGDLRAAQTALQLGKVPTLTVGYDQDLSTALAQVPV